MSHIDRDEDPLQKLQKFHKIYRKKGFSRNFPETLFCVLRRNFNPAVVPDFQVKDHDVMTLIPDEPASSKRLYAVYQTEDRGRAVYASRRIPAGTTVHVASEPFVSVIKEKFKKEVCAWCFKYQHGKNCSVKQSDTRTGVWFCSVGCLHEWTNWDYDGKLAKVLASLRSNGARKVIRRIMNGTDKSKQMSNVESFPLDQAKLVASAIVQRSRYGKSADSPWEDVLDLQSGIFDDEIDLPSEIEQITPFLKQTLPVNLHYLVESTAYPFLSRHLSNSFGIWELPISPDSENLGSAMYPSASYFNHSCDPNVTKIRQGRKVLFITSRDVARDEELCISYGHTDRDLEERRQVLRDWWGFTCNCSRCRRELDIQHS